jgi:hypothetical protein
VLHICGAVASAGAVSAHTHDAFAPLVGSAAAATAGGGGGIALPAGIWAGFVERQDKAQANTGALFGLRSLPHVLLISAFHTFARPNTIMYTDSNTYRHLNQQIAFKKRSGLSITVRGYYSPTMKLNPCPNTPCTPQLARTGYRVRAFMYALGSTRGCFQLVT